MGEKNGRRTRWRARLKLLFFPPLQTLCPALQPLGPALSHLLFAFDFGVDEAAVDEGSQKPAFFVVLLEKSSARYNIHTFTA